MRLFISVNLPPPAQKELADLTRRLEKHHWPVVWQRQEKIHITLAFLGRFKETKLFELQAAVGRASQEIKSFSITFKGLGAFPDFIQPRVVWVGLKGDLKSLAALQKGIGKELKKADVWFDQKPFVPHVTIGRVKKGISKGALRDLGKKIRQMRKIDFRSQIEVSDVAIMKSESTPQGSVYTKLASIKL